MSNNLSAVLFNRLRFRLPPLLKNLSITFVENVITKGLSFLSILVLTRMLGPEDYGRYSFIFVMVALGSALFDFGMENTAVRFAARDKAHKQEIFGLYLTAKLSTLMVLVMFFVLAGAWMFGVMGKAEVAQYLPYLVVGLIGESLFFVNDTYLQANQQFKMRAILNIARFAAVLLYIGILFLTGQVSLETVFYSYWIPLGFSLLFLPTYVGFLKAYIQKSLEKPLLREIIGYERWMFMYSIANNLLGRIDFFMLGFWVGFQQLGIYNAASQLCAIVSFLPLVLGKVLLPALSELQPEAVCQKMRKLIRGTNLVCAAAFILVPLTPWVVPLFLGPEYVEAVPILQILLVKFILSLVCMPYDQALYAMGQPKMLSIGRYVQLFLIVILNWVLFTALAPGYSIYVAAYTGLLGRVWYLYYVRKSYLEQERKIISGQREEVIAGLT